MASVNPPEDAQLVIVNGQAIDPHEVYAKDARNTDYIVITVRAILSMEEEEELHDLSVTIIEDLGNNNFLCRYPLDDLGPIRGKEFVRQVDVYRNKYKIPAALESSVQEDSAVLQVPSDGATSAPPPNLRTVDVLTHETVKDDEFEDLKLYIANKSGVSVEDMGFAPGLVRLTMDASKLADIAQNDMVRIIEEVVEPQLMSTSSDDARPIIRGNDETMQSLYTGKGQIVTVTDTGFDTGDANDCHPAFTEKIFALIPVERASAAKLLQRQKTNDPDGHGTHVSGIISGIDFDTTKGRIGGIAPGVKLIVQSCYKEPMAPLKIPEDLTKLFEVPYRQGSRIFSNSWGRGFAKGQQPDYQNAAAVIDNFVRGKADALICFAAGNDNLKAVGKPTIGLHAGAKNVLTVGATGNQTAPDRMYDESSFGPTKQLRQKPDVVAPGVSILSALSRGKPKFEGIAVTAADTDAKWKFESGTSQATPLVAGCAAILREALEESGCFNPPGALLKAVLINGADLLPGIPVNAQGYGRVNLQASLAMVKNAPFRSKGTTISPSIVGGTIIGDALKQDGDYEFTVSPSHEAISHTHFKVTMVYNDIGNTAIQNNLNLFLIDAGTNTTVPGNGKSLDDLDVQNNVEQIILDYVPRQGLKFRVHANKILALQEQDFVLAWSIFTPLTTRGP